MCNSSQGVVMNPTNHLRHVAVIMDGNGRWAQKRGLPRSVGHKAGAEAARKCVKAAITHDIPWLTLYVFSSENWKRSTEEVSALTGLLRYYIRHELAALHKENVRIFLIGDLSRFNSDLQKELYRAVALTENNTGLNLVLALSYGARAELVVAAAKMAKDVQEGRLLSQNINEEIFASYLATAHIPDPDMVIRTSGEYRLSNFLLWQSAYAELIFMDVFWPDFSEEHFQHAMKIFGQRERRFGNRPLANVESS